MNKLNKVIISLIIVTTMLTGYVFAAVDYEALAASKYKDVKETAWYAGYVGKLTELNIINGYNNAFDPDGFMTRAQFIKVLVQAMGYKKVDSVSFIDMRANSNAKPHWAAVYVETALRNGVILKEEEGDRFYPDIPLLRRDMAVMMCRALKLDPSNGTNPFADVTEPNGYITKLYENYLLLGEFINGMRIYKPSAMSSRAEVTAIISRMLEYKADPEGYVERMARAERIANGTATAADLEAVRQEEIAKAKADPNYIIKPDIRILNTMEDFAGYDDPADTFDYFAGFIAIDNLEDLVTYNPDCQYKIVATDKSKDLINTVTRLTEPFISYDHVYEVRTDYWTLLKRAFGYSEEVKTYTIKSIKRDEEKSVNGKWVSVPDYVKKGETLNFKLYLKRGTNTEIYDIKFKVN